MAVKTFSTGEVLTASNANTYLANSGLVYITEAAASTGSSISVNGCFSSLYRNYKVVISKCQTSGVAATNLKLLTGTTPAPSTYYYNGTYMAYNSATVNGVNGSNVATWDTNIVTSTSMVGGSFDIFNPNVAHVTTINCFGGDARTDGGGMRMMTGMHNTSAAYDGFTFTTGSTFTSVEIIVYGFRQA